MKVVIVNCFDTYEDRVLLLQSYFLKRGHTVRVVTSDYRHFRKSYRTDRPEGFIFIHAKRYKKNLSVKRLISHEGFAKDAVSKVRKLRPDLLWVLAPPNSIIKSSVSYSRSNPDMRLVVDVIDMWPETMPVGRLKFTPPFQIWKALRDRYIDKADLVVTECELYKKVLSGRCDRAKLKTLYLAKRVSEPESEYIKDMDSARETMQTEDADCVSGKQAPPSDRWELCYLGSMNNIIDTECIGDIIRALPKRPKKTLIHLIGDGEKKAELTRTCTEAGGQVVFHGKIYDAVEKRKIFDTCHYGLNIMKNSVFVGLTMKSLDYFSGGLPIINNIEGDTYYFVEKRNIGINFRREKVLSEEELSKYMEMRRCVRTLFKEKFTVECFEKRLDEILKPLTGG